jgi:pantothenate kinase type III
MQSGLFWGAVGGARELIHRMSEGLSEPPQVFLTGGAAPSVAHLLAADAQYVPHLVLGGIALAASRS